MLNCSARNVNALTSGMICSECDVRLGMLVDDTIPQELCTMQYTSFDKAMHMCQLCPYLNVGVLTTLVHALVISGLDYCNALCMGLPLRLMQKLQMRWPDFSLG